jgi:Protein of unknown function (DUF1189)
MKKFSVLHPLVLSFYSRELYQDVGRNWRGTGFAYLLLLLALCWAPEMFKMQAGMTKFARNEGAAVIKQIPAVAITNGEVSTDVQTPYFIKDPKTGVPMAIIDLTGQYTSLADTPAKMLLTKNQLLTKNNYETKTYDLRNVKSFKLDQARVQGWLDLARQWLAIILYPVVLVFSYAYRILQALLYGAIAMLFASAVKAKMNYLTALRLATIAVTPAIIVDTLHSLAGIKTPLWWLICFVIAMVYLYFGVKANGELPAASPGQPADIAGPPGT